MGVGDYVACLQRDRREEGKRERRATLRSASRSERGVRKENSARVGGTKSEQRSERASEPAATNLRIGGDPGHRRLPVVPLTPSSSIRAAPKANATVSGTIIPLVSRSRGDNCSVEAGSAAAPLARRPRRDYRAAATPQSPRDR